LEIHQFSPETKSVFGLLLAFVLFETPLMYHINVQVSCSRTYEPLSRVLKPLTFFLSRAPDSSRFVLKIPEFHLKTINMSEIDRVVRLMCHAAGVGLRMTEPWRVFEVLPVHAVAVRAALSYLPTDTCWAEVFPALFSGSAIARQLIFCLGKRNVHNMQDVYSMQYDGELRDSIRNMATLKKLCDNGAMVGHKESPTADLIYVQRVEMGDDGMQHIGVLEWLPKLWLRATLTWST
jgi:hypothetical protein